MIQSLTQTENAFADIPKGQRAFMVTCVAAYMLLISAVAFLDGKMQDKMFLLGSSLLFLGVASFPLVFKLKNDGFLHPLVLTSALLIVTTVIRKSDLLANGLDVHYALPGFSKRKLYELVAYVNLLGAISLLAKYAGYYALGNLFVPLVKFNKRPNSLFVPALFLWLLLGLLCLFLLISASGGIYYHLKNITLGSHNRIFYGSTALLGAYSFVIQSCVAIPVLYAAFMKNGHKSLIFVGLVLISFGMVYLTNGRRSSILVPSYLAFGMWIYKERKLPLIRIIMMAVLIFFFLSAGKVFRQAHQTKSSKLNLNFLAGYTVTELAELSMQELSDRSGNAAAIYPIIVYVPKRFEYNYFQSYLENAYRFVPRSVWPDKPDGIGITCSEVFYNRYNAGGVPPGPLGEAYWSLGIPGVIIVYFFFGMIIRGFTNAFLQNPKSIGILVIYLLTVLRFGPDQISFRVWIFTMVPLLSFLFVTNLIALKGR